MNNNNEIKIILNNNKDGSNSVKRGIADGAAMKPVST